MLLTVIAMFANRTLFSSANSQSVDLHKLNAVILSLKAELEKMQMELQALKVRVAFLEDQQQSQPSELRISR